MMAPATQVFFSTNTPGSFPSAGPLHVLSLFSWNTLPEICVHRRCFPGPPHLKALSRDIAGGAVVKNLPANTGDTGSSPGLGRSHMLQSN